jgi:hypothetical protein
MPFRRSQFPLSGHLNPSNKSCSLLSLGWSISIACAHRVQSHCNTCNYDVQIKHKPLSHATFTLYR